MQVFNRLSASEKKELKKGVIEVSGRAMNRTALGIVDAMIQLYPKASFEELKQMMPDTINPSAPRNYKSLFKPYTDRPYGVIQPGSIRQECEAQGLDIHSSHFTGEGEVFKAGDGTEVLVSRTWESKDTETGEKDLQNLIDHVQQYGVKVVDYADHKPFSKGQYSKEVVNPELLALLHKKAEKKFPWWLILLLLLLLGLAAYFLLFNKKPAEKVVAAPPPVDTPKPAPLPPAAPKDSVSMKIEAIKADINAGINTENKSVSFENIYFPKGSDQILPSSDSAMNQSLNFLTEIPSIKVKIIGHTSDEGSASYNKKLSLKRAKSVQKVLLDKGVDPKRISVDGMGFDKPVAPNDTEEGRMKNRRIEFLITDDGVKNQ